MTAIATENRPRASRFGWVDVAKGLCIVAVVGLYTRNELEAAFGQAGWLDPWSAFARPFRMPDFFLLSGLFLSVVIDRPWRSYLDTKLVHYAYFLLLWIALIFTYDVFFLNHDPAARQSVAAFVKAYVWKVIFPDHMLWFIQTLPAFFLVTRALRRVPKLLLWGVAAVVMASHARTGLDPIDNFLTFYVFFLSGHFAAPWIFGLADRARSHRAATAALFVAWCFVNQWAVSAGWTAQPGLDLAFGFLGIAAVIGLSNLLADVSWLGWLRYAGANTIVIYLGFFIPLTLFIHVVATNQITMNIHLLATLAVLVGAATPLLLFRLVKGTAAQFLFVRPDWAYLAAPRRRAAPVRATTP